MAYKVRLTARAEEDANAAFEGIRDAAPDSAARWLRGLFAAIMSLESMPARCPVIPEADELGRSVRHLLYGKRTSVYRIIFDIQEMSEEGPRVRVLRIWHGARAPIAAEDIASEW
jgi:plasmid stabilization system protein ParE